MARGTAARVGRTGGTVGRVGSGEGPAGDASGGTGRPAVDCRWPRATGAQRAAAPRGFVSRRVQAALASLEPRPAGRPVRMPEEGPETAETLQATIRDLRLDLRAARVREEIALTMPDLLRATGRGSRSGAAGDAGPPRGRDERQAATAAKARPGAARSPGQGAARPGRPAARSENGSGVSVPGPWPTTAGPPATGSP